MKQAIALMHKDLGENLRELLIFRGFELKLINELEDLRAQSIIDDPDLLILDESFLSHAQFKTFIDSCLVNTPCIILTYEKPPPDVGLKGLSTLGMPFSIEELYQVVNKSMYEYPLSA
ncbi:MAG: hypothetical protein AAF696_14665 [Bacteroidota bacterium]